MKYAEKQKKRPGDHNSHRGAHAPAACFVRKRKKAHPQLIVSQLRVGFSDGLCCRSHTDANEVVVLSVVFHGSPGPVGDIVVFVRYQGLDAAATIVVAALRRAVLPGGPFPQTADLRDGPGKVGNVFLHVRQPGPSHSRLYSGRVWTRNRGDEAGKC